MLVKGQKAPAFSVENEAGKSISLDDYQGKRNVVLYFILKMIRRDVRLRRMILLVWQMNSLILIRLY